MASDVTTKDQLVIDTIRTLSMDAVQKANSGHPGTPMALAPVAYTVWKDFLRYDPLDPRWPNRDRFVLSCGHASMLLYSLIHLAGIRDVDAEEHATDSPAVSLDDIKNFRQWGSRTPGHPEYGLTAGVETTTGPLGQGCGNSVGMAIAARWMAERYNQPDITLFDYNVYALASDGDLMEGVACEAASLAGHLRLPNLCWIYDDNRITIEGSTELAFSEDVATRFQGLGWMVRHVADANDLVALQDACKAFLANDESPTLIVVRSHIAYGAPHKQDTHDAHGSPLGDEEIRLTKQRYGWPENETFRVPREAAEYFQAAVGQRGQSMRRGWQEQLNAYRARYPGPAAQLDCIRQHRLPDGWDADLPEFPPDSKGQATRASAGKAVNALAQRIPWFVGGSADLAPSTKTEMTSAEAGHFGPGNHRGRNFHFGVREHAMAAAVNGMTLSGLRAFGATFFVFSDYLRPAMRLSALMELPSLFVFTHDSIGVGEDGPTHQPVEHLAAARAIPGLVVLRPADANEVVEAWRTVMMLKRRPAALVLTRQNLPTLDRTKFAGAAGVARGAYVLSDCPSRSPDVILIGTGSEVPLCVEASSQLTDQGIQARIVSMPSWELFDEQDADYREQVLPNEARVRVAVEAGIRQGWDRYIGPHGRFVGVENRFGASAPYDDVYRGVGLTCDAVIQAAQNALSRCP